jgi:FkbM family methyltransferase
MISKSLLSYWVKRFQRVQLHLWRGTLLKRLQMELISHIDHRNERKHWRRLWESRVGKRNKVEIEIQTGIPMCLYSDSRLSLDIYEGNFELQEREFLNAFLRPGDIFVDLGANLGFFTLIGAHRVGETGRVYAFEPCLKTFQRLLSNITLNHLTNVFCHQMALSDHSGQRDMAILSDGFDAWNSFARIPRTPSAVEKVKCTTWDDFATEHNLMGRVTMMKIDVEGWETHVLSGGVKALSREDAPILQVEFSDATCRCAGSSCERLYHILEELGYQMFLYDPTSRELFFDPLRKQYEYVNLIAIKRPEQVMSRLRGIMIRTEDQKKRERSEMTG